MLQSSANRPATHRVLAGIRATGRLHLGNYLGAVKGMLALQAREDLKPLFMVADVHSITTPFDVTELSQHRREVFIDYLAAGLDPNKSTLFLQSMVPEHLELAFLLSSVVSIARMQHLPTFKEKVAQYPDQATMALLNYPVLMAADILIYKADLVPVGIDQEPHLEIAREIARKINELYGLDFPEPQRFATSGEYIPSLKGEGKMSKTVEGSYIAMTDDLATIQKRLAGAPTDSGKGTIRIETAERGGKRIEKKMYVDQSGTDSVGVTNLLTLVELFLGEKRRTELDTMYTSGSGIRYGELKAELADSIFSELQPFQEARHKLVENPSQVDSHIIQGALQARAVASATVQEVKTAMGLG